jgi:hypothetical protein
MTLFRNASVNEMLKRKTLAQNYIDEQPHFIVFSDQYSSYYRYR